MKRTLEYYAESENKKTSLYLPDDLLVDLKFMTLKRDDVKKVNDLILDYIIEGLNRDIKKLGETNII